MRFDDFNWKDIIYEAPEDDLDDGGDLSATDYADAGDDVDVAEADPMADEGGETEDVTDDTEADPADEDPLGEDEEGGDPADEDPMADDAEGGDPADEDPLADDAEGGSDENPEDEQTDNMEDNVSSDKQNVNLINDFIELHRRIDTIMQQIRTDCKTNIRYNPNMLVVRGNLEKLKAITYDYIINKFAKESYVANLYQFNLIIQALNTNIDLLSSVLASNKKFEEANKKDKKKKDEKKSNSKKKK